MSRLLAIMSLAVFVPATTGCFGGYNLTRDFYDWNKNISDSKWVVWLVHVPVLIVIWFPAMLDGLIFNSDSGASGPGSSELRSPSTTRSRAGRR